MFQKLDEIERRYADLEARSASPEVLADHALATKTMRAMREILPIVEKNRERKRIDAQLAGAQELLDTLRPADELRPIAQQELEALKARRDAIEEEILGLRFRLEVPCESIERIRPWAIPLPAAGFSGAFACPFPLPFSSISSASFAGTSAVFRHFGYPLHPRNRPRRPLRMIMGLPHSSQSMSVVTAWGRVLWGVG